MEFRHFTNLKQNLTKQKGGVIPLLGVSLIIFAVTVAVYFTANYVAEGVARQGALTGWEYGYTNRAGTVPEGELRMFSAQNPLVTDDDVRRDCIYFVKTLEASDENRAFVVRTDHSPVTIKVNGREVYRNQPEAAYVGNCYNAVTIEASTRDPVVEVFMRLPFSVRFDAELQAGEARVFSPTAGFYTGAALLLLGVGGALFALIFGAVKKRKSRVAAASGVVAYCGAGLTLMQASEVTYLLNFRIWTNISQAFMHLALMMALLLVIGWFPHRRKLLVSALFAIGISVPLVIAAVDPLLLNITCIAMSLLFAAAIAYVAYNALEQVHRRTQYASAFFVVMVYFCLTALLSGILLLCRSIGPYLYAVILPSLVVCGMIICFGVAAYRFEQKNRELYQQSKRSGESVDNISKFIGSVLACHDREQFPEIAAKELSALVTGYHERNAALCWCVGVRNAEDGFDEVVNHGVSGCRYEIVERNSVVNHRSCVFADTYFDFIIEGDAKAQVIFHYENLSGGLDLFFISMLEAAYCGLETAYRNVCGDNPRPVTLILEELAENAELANGYSLGHLNNICDLTRRLCLALGMDAEEAERMALASKLHDLGKIAVPQSIINKEGLLTEEERVIVSSHSEFGYLILSAYDDPLLVLAAEIARYHHERWDGSGANGLESERIPYSARIVAICDVYDALVSERPYKKPWTKERALSYIADNAGKLFDPKPAKVFVREMKE